jgi:NAD(P)-dependent dehydrogenase (short-subunit alcohol dehydrogenase family)
VAIVTGAARGFGRAFCHYLAVAGADIAAIDLDGDGAESTAAEIRGLGRRAVGIAVDTRDSAQVWAATGRVVKELGGPTVLVNNAGINTGNDTPPEELALEIWDQVINTNLTGYFRFCQAVLGPMRSAGGGKIINIASTVATRVPRLPGRHTTSYTVSKAGVIALTRCLGLEWAQYGICVNAISPTYSDTGLIRREPALLELMVASSPFHRLGRPSDVMGILLYLASPASDFTTGHDFLIDGGYSI